jgi:hypothetical protein
MDDQDIPFNRTNAIFNSVEIINKLINQEKKPLGTLDPIDSNDIISANIQYLSVEKDKGSIPVELISSIESAIIDGGTYVINNPSNGGGGGGNTGVLYFTDCYKGFVFAIDFGHNVFNTKNGQVYYISVNGYNGCATVSVAEKGPTPYNGSDYKNFDQQSDCISCLKKFGGG